MTMFIKLENGQPVGDPVIEDNFRHLFPGVSFSWPFVPEDIEPHGFGIYEFSVAPECGVFEKVVEVSPVKDESGRWVQSWAIEPMTAEECENRTQQQWMFVRSNRSMLLSMCDWTQIADSPLSDEKKAEWAVYRQALRDITDTQTDPFNITWPAKPASN